MRLWHQFLIPYLDDKRLLGQYRECCALRGKGWGKKHSVVDYVFKYDLGRLYQYHCTVMYTMSRRLMQPDMKWYLRTYRGKSLPQATLVETGSYVYHYVYHNRLIEKLPFKQFISAMKNDKDRCLMIYPEHDLAYLKECLLNLKSKGAELKGPVSIEEMLVEIDLALDS